RRLRQREQSRDLDGRQDVFTRDPARRLCALALVDHATFHPLERELRSAACSCAVSFHTDTGPVTGRRAENFARPSRLNPVPPSTRPASDLSTASRSWAPPPMLGFWWHRMTPIV